MNKIKQTWGFDVKTGRYVCAKEEKGSHIKKDNGYERKRKRKAEILDKIKKILTD